MNSSNISMNFNNNSSSSMKYFGMRNFFKKIKKYVFNKSNKNLNTKKEFSKLPEPEIKNIKIKKKRTTRANIIHIVLFFISYIFYYISLDRCYDGEDVCTTNPGWIATILVTLFTSIIINIILFLLIIYNKVSPLNLVHFIIVFIIFYQISHETISEDHGYYNFVGFFSLLWLFIVLGLICHGIFIIIRSKYRYAFFIFVLSFIIFLLFIIYKMNPVNCNDWTLGLNNTVLVNNISKYGCQIRIPKSCTFKVLSGTQDFSKITNLDCAEGKIDARKTILEAANSPYINKNTKRFGYPKTNNEEVGGLDGRDKEVLLNYTYENLLDMDNITSDIKYYPEVIVDFTENDRGEMKVNLSYNDTLSKERKKLEGKISPYANNVMILYLDAVSRALAIRQLKKTLNFVEKFMSYNGGHHEKYPEENFHSFQFFKYHCFRRFTPGNFPILFYGNKREINDIKVINKYFKENGYVTNYCMDMCKKDGTRTYHNMTQAEMYDHQMLLCDPNLVEMNKPIKKCLYGHINTYHLYKYAYQFWTRYKDNRKFSVLVTNDAHESSLEALKYSDDIIYNYLNSLYEQNLLKDTTILMVSDHGTTLPSVYFLNDFFQIEARLPMLFIIVNDRKNVSYFEQYYHIHENQQTFITAYDFYNTVSNLLFGDEYVKLKNKTDNHDKPKSPKGQSLFDYIDPMSRNPKNYENMDTNVCKK